MSVFITKKDKTRLSLVRLLPLLLVVSVLSACGGGGGGSKNEAPVAVDDAATLNEGATANIALAANDTDADDGLDLTSIAITSGPTNGAIVVNTNGTVDYTHDGTETTSDSFTYTIKDKTGAASGVATVTITVVPVNDPPVANDDAGTVSEGTGVTIDLAANDTDIDNALDLTSIIVVTAPANGAVTVNTDGTVVYTHNGSETLSDSFTYTINDAGGATSNVATVSITVTPVNDSPVANNDTATVNEGGSGIINVAANDTDADDGLDLTTVAIVTGPGNGSVVVNADGTVTYTHNGSETTNDSFTYTINDASGAVSNTATVSITVTPVNDVPVANNDSATVNEAATVNIDLAANDTDPENSLDLASIAIVAAPTNGSVVINSNGTVDYTHDGSETTSDSFTYTIADTAGATSNTATVSITVNPVNDPPVANNDSATVNEGASININLAANDTDADNALDLATIVIVSNPTNGALVVNVDGTVDYTHNGGETISDSFTYTIKDVSAATSNTATVSITVTPVNDAPVANDDAVSINVGQQAIFDLAANDTDVDSLLDLTSIIVSATTNGGTVDSVNNDGTVTYTAPSGTSITSDSFTYTIKDASGLISNTATVTVTVLQNFNEALYATPTFPTGSPSTSAKRALQANDGLTVTSDPANGWVSTDALPQSIRLTFDSPKLIHRITLSDLASLTDNVLTGTISFSNGDPTIPVGALPTDGTAKEYLLSPPKLVSWIEVSIDSADSANLGLSEFSAYSALDPGQTVAFTELFNDSDVAIAGRWPVTNECTSGTAAWSGLDGGLAVNNEYVQTGACRGFNTEGVELGTYPVLDSALYNTENMDLRLRFKSGGTGATWVNGALGVLFAYRSTDHYRLDVSQVEGHTKLWKKVAGTYTELTTSPQSYTPGEWVNLRIVRQNDVIVVYMNSVKTLAVQDTTSALKNASFQQVALLCARNEDCQFENVTILTTPSDPIVGVNVDDDGGAGHQSGEYFVDTTGTLNLVAVVTDATGIDGVEFEVDGDTVTAQIDATAPYTATFASLTTGIHTVRAYLRDVSGRLTDADAVEVLPSIGVNGINLVGLGDSITGGLRDDVPSDDTSADGRNTSGGYQPILNDLLTTANGVPVTILNEGNPGELSAEGAARIAAVLARTPAARGYLAIYGANDSSAGAGPVASGLGLIPGDAGYAGSFKDNMQQIIDAVVAAGKKIYLGKTLPFPLDAGRDTVVNDYNLVIDELITANTLGYTAADFHTWFTNNPTEMNADGIHPNGLGYQSMSNNNAVGQDWCDTLNGQDGMICP